MLIAAGTKVRSLDQERLGQLLTEAGLAYTVSHDDAFIVEGPTHEVGKVALAGQIVLTELRSGGSGLEEMFLELTSDDAREEVTS